MHRITTFARGSSVPAATLNAMQDRAVGLRPASGKVALAPLLYGRDGVYWSSPDAGVPDGASVVIDASRDWRNGHLRATFVRLTSELQRLHRSDAWKRNDPSQAIAVRTVADAWTGTGCAASDGVPTISSGHFGIIVDELSAGADRVYLFADSENGGALTLYNDSGATLHAELFVEGAFASAAGGGTSAVPGLSVGDVDTADDTWTTIVTLSLGTSSSVLLRGRVAVISSDGGDAGAFDFSVRVRRGASGALAVSTQTFHYADFDGTGWDVRVQASGSDVVVQVQGEAATDLTWHAEIEAVEARIAA